MKQKIKNRIVKIKRLFMDVDDSQDGGIKNRQHDWKFYRNY